MTRTGLNQKHRGATNKSLCVIIIVMLMQPMISDTNVALAKDWDAAGTGARAEGLGGAYISIAGDATALYWNPAGLSKLEQIQASFGSRFVSENAEYTDDYLPSTNTSADQSHVAFNFGSIALPVRLGSANLVLALAYQQHADFDENLMIDLDSKKAQGGLGTYAAGFGLDAGGILSVGAAVNFWTGKNEVAQVFGTNLVSNETFGYKGSNVTAGVLLDLNKLETPIPLAFGVCAHSAFTMKVGKDITVEDREVSTRRQYHLDQTTRLPFILGGGISVRPFGNLTLAVDAEMRKYAEIEYPIYFNGYSRGTMKVTPPQENQLRLGAEYLIQAGQFVIPLRGGYKILPAGYQNFYGQATGKAFAFGSGIRYSRFALDVSYTSGKYNIADTAYLGEIHSISAAVNTSLVVFI